MQKLHALLMIALTTFSSGCLLLLPDNGVEESDERPDEIAHVIGDAWIVGDIGRHEGVDMQAPVASAVSRGAYTEVTLSNDDEPWLTVSFTFY